MAEGIKISEMDAVTTLEDGCCFPVVSKGSNKKISLKNLYALMNKELDYWKTISDNYLGTLDECSVGTWCSINTSDYTHVNTMPEKNGWATVFTFCVASNVNYKQQLCIYINSNTMYLRTCVNEIWKSWKKIASDVEITDLQNQVTSNDTDISNLQNQITDLQSQITNISKPNNIEIFRYAINESTENWIVSASGDKYKVIDLPTTITVINSCLSNNGNAEVTNIFLNEERKLRVTICVDSDVTSCKGYFEYMI